MYKLYGKLVSNWQGECRGHAGFSQYMQQVIRANVRSKCQVQERLDVVHVYILLPAHP